MADQYKVFGNPIAHSKSPEIHQAFAKQTAQDIVYEKQLVELDAFEDSVVDFFEAGGQGLNITVPFKQQAWDLADVRTEHAERAGAVNTLYQNQQGRLVGANTDGLGLARDIWENNDISLYNKRILVLGAGGAVRGTVQALLAAKPSQLVITNRTQSKAEELAELFAEFGDISGSGFADLEGQQFDMIINGTAASLAGELPPLPQNILAPSAYCYDMMYSAESTVFCRWAQDQGAEGVFDGLGMLVEQAAEAFEIWRDIRPETETVIKELRQALAATKA